MSTLNFKRKKAFLGAAINAATAMTTALIQKAATEKAAKQQADAINENAKSTAEALQKQNENAIELQNEMVNVQTNMNKENNDIIRDMQATLQMVSGNEQNTYRDQANKIMAKNGAGVSIKNFNKPFKVIDGGGVIPLNVDNNGYGLYEIVGNDHEHYHKTNGKYKSGVGIKFNNGQVVEGEGNQNTSKGEKLYVTPNRAMFLSKHNIKGFNPSDAVDNGLHPADAFAMQEQIKAANGITNDGKKYETGGWIKPNPYTDYSGAMINSAGNITGALINGLGSIFSSNKLAKAQLKAGDIMSDAYKNLKTFDMNLLNDYVNSNDGRAMAVVRAANTNINPQLERIRRNASAERDSANSNLMSSAARQNMLMKIVDSAYQRASELYANKHNANETIKRENAQQISTASATNAQLDTQKSENNAAVIERALEFNTDTKNKSILGSAQSLADALINSRATKSQGWINATSTMGDAVTATGNAFGTAYDAGRKLKFDTYNVLAGIDQNKVVKALSMLGDKDGAFNLYNSLQNSTNPYDIKARNELNNVFHFKKSEPLTLKDWNKLKFK